jgi:DNA-binding NarL/FixJ family response regulator
VRLYAQKAIVELFSIHRTEALKVTMEQLRKLANLAVPASRAAQLTLAGFLGVHGESCHEISSWVQRGLDDNRFLDQETCESLPAVLALWALLFTDDLARARVLAEAMLTDARTRGSVVGFVTASGHQGMAALRRGALAEAEAEFRAVLELVTNHDLVLGVPLHAACLGATLIERGKPDEAAAIVESVVLTSALMELSPVCLFLEARGRVRLARGQRAQAIADLRRCGQLADHSQLCNPNFVAWRSTLALALAAEDPVEAWELAQTELQLARRAGLSRAIGIALRVCGILTGGQEGIELLDQSVTVLEASPARLELAHSLTELGAALRRAGARTAARHPLHRALDLAHRCGATPLAQRARDEALAAGARPRRPWASGVPALTPSELRVARLAAQGMANRDIAQALFITTKTVSDHLSSAYRKLNISSRDELTTAMTPHALLDNH